MNTKSSEAMAFSASSAAQSPGKDPLPCLSNAEILKVAGEKQDWGSENGPADPVDEAMEDSVEPWYAHIPTLAAVYGEMCMINETLLKEQTDGQKERLKVLRSECVAAHNLRIEANLARNRAARVLADKQSKLVAAPKRKDPAVAAIEFSLTQGEGDIFLKSWMEGDWETIRKEWPEAPEDVFV